MELQEKDDAYYMKEAFIEAEKAYQLGETPIGCVIVYQGKIIGRGYNRRAIEGSVLAHAEIKAIQEACAVLGDWRLEECTFYVTLEPCPMCAGAIVQARAKRLVYATENWKAGSAGTVINLMNIEGFNHQVEVENGIQKEEGVFILQNFFRNLRLKKKKENPHQHWNNESDA